MHYGKSPHPHPDTVYPSRQSINMMSGRTSYQPEVLVISESSGWGGNEIHLPEGRAVHPFPYLVRSSFRCLVPGSAVFGTQLLPLAVRLQV